MSMTEETVYLLYLDDYHAGDGLFLQRLARSLSRPAGVSCLIVHGSGEHAERMLEAEGLFLKRTSGLLPVQTTAEHQIVERAIEETNRKIVKLLADAVVPAVGIVGNRRRLLVLKDGLVGAQNVTWLRKLASKGVIPVVAAYARESDSNRTGEVPLNDAVVALAAALPGLRSEVVFFARRKVAAHAGDRISYEEITGSEADVEGLHFILQAGLPAILTTTLQISDSGEIRGTRVESH